MNSCHCVVLLFALVVAPLASAVDDDQADQEYCEDTDLCEGDLGKAICATMDAGVRTQLLSLSLLV